MNNLKLQKANEEKIAKEVYEKALALKGEVEKGEVVVAIKAGENGKTFGSVSSKEIAKAVSDQMNLEIDKKKIQLPDAIKTFGVYQVDVKLHQKVTAVLKVKVQEA